MEILGTSQHKGVFVVHYIANHKLRHIHRDDREAVKQKMRDAAKEVPGFVPFETKHRELKNPRDISDTILHPENF